jgi:hypothetical protein
MKDKLLEAQDRQKDNTDKSRKAHPMINIGDKIWLLRCNLKTNHPSNKIDFCRLRPFPVIKQINDVIFRPELIPSMKIHLVFHVSLLKLYKESSIPGRVVTRTFSDGRTDGRSDDGRGGVRDLDAL